MASSNAPTYPDLRYVIDDIFATNNRVAFRWAATGTQRGSLWGIIPPTGQTLSWSGIHMLRVENNQIVEKRFLTAFEMITLQDFFVI